MLQIASLQFASIKPDDSGSVAVYFRARRPLPFKAGQFGLWIVPGGGFKPFTVASAPGEEFITLGTSLKVAKPLQARARRTYAWR